MKFQDYRIADTIKENLAQMGFFRPTDIQFKAIPPIQTGDDLFAVAQTGTGKTAAYAIPLVDRIHQGKKSRRSAGIRCLVMVPTRELARQVGSVFNRIAKNTHASLLALHGGVEQDPQITRLDKGVDILIATPGRMFDLIHQGKLTLQSVRCLVLDEADRMLDLGFMDDIVHIKRLMPQEHQTLFISATIHPEIKRSAYHLVKGSAIHIQISPDDPVSKNVTHALLKVHADNKRAFLERILTENAHLKGIVFLRTRVRTERLAAHLIKAGFQVMVLHGEKDQADRQATLEAFRNLENGLLLATDLSARGIDIAGVAYVVNYDLPTNPENYVHRIGRTGRGHEKGSALTLMTPEDHPTLEAIEAFLGHKIPMVHLGKSEFTKTVALFPTQNEEDPKAFIRDYEQWIQARTTRKRKGRPKQ